MHLDCDMGAFLVAPIPREITRHGCSHPCHYCCANRTAPDRRADVGRIARQRRAPGGRP